MRNRRLIYTALSAIALLLCLIVGYALWDLNHKGPTRWNQERIRAGMMVDEALELMRDPPTRVFKLGDGTGYCWEVLPLAILGRRFGEKQYYGFVALDGYVVKKVGR